MENYLELTAQLKDEPEEVGSKPNNSEAADVLLVQQ